MPFKADKKMSINYEEHGPRNKLSSNPSPLIQLDGRPLVPEVSVLLDKEKVHFTCNEPRLTDLNIDGKLTTNCQNAEQSNVNNKESYGTWRAKNNQMYSAIPSDGNSEGFNNLPLKSCGSGSLRKKNVGYDTRPFPTEDDYILHHNSKELTNKRNSRLHERHFRQHEGMRTNTHVFNSDNRFIHCKELCSSEREHSNPKSDQQYKNTTISEHSDNHIHCKSIEKQGMHIYQPVSINTTQPNSNNPLRHSSNSNDVQEIAQFKSNKNNVGTMNNCQCSVQNRNIKNSSEEQEQVNQIDIKDITNKPFSALDLSQVNSQIIDLHNIIHHQNEQILILKQQILEIHYDCLKRSQNMSCHKCTDNYKCSQDYNRICLKDRCPHENGIIDKRSIGVMTVPEVNTVSKRSVGIMAVPLQNIDTALSNVHAKRDNKNPNEGIKQQNSETTYASLVHYHDKEPIQKKMSKKNERNKIAQDVSTIPNMKKTKKKPKHIPRENSFSLNEADILIRTSVEQDDISPNSSVHVDMQEYYSSSTKSNYSDTSESCSDDDSEENSEEVGSVGPQFGHTFYNLVVDQVNKIVQPTHPNKEQVMSARRVMTDHGYGANEAYGMENNWSKRVTFDGPPLEDSDNHVPNILHGPRHNHQKHIQDYKGVPDRMKDFLLYNIADGSTNLSIASLRYLERYNLPSSQPNGKKTGIIPEEHSRKYKKKKKKKIPVLERDSNFHQQYNKKFNATSSKLLDITALKQQPKLF